MFCVCVGRAGLPSVMLVSSERLLCLCTVGMRVRCSGSDTRDTGVDCLNLYHLDWSTPADHMGDEKVVEALYSFDRLYPQPSGESALQQLQIQLANPMPYDLEELNLAEYKNLAPRWHDWQAVKAVCVHVAILIFDRIVGV